MALKWQIIPQLEFNSDGCETTYIPVIIPSFIQYNPNWKNIDVEVQMMLLLIIFSATPSGQNLSRLLWQFFKKGKERELDEIGKEGKKGCYLNMGCAWLGFLDGGLLISIMFCHRNTKVFFQVSSLVWIVYAHLPVPCLNNEWAKYTTPSLSRSK